MNLKFTSYLSHEFAFLLWACKHSIGAIEDRVHSLPITKGRMNAWFVSLKCLAWLYYISPSYKCQQWWNRWWTNLSDPFALVGSRLVLHNSRKIHTSQSWLRVWEEVGERDLCFFEPAVNFQAARIWTVTVNHNPLGTQFLSYSVGFSFTWKTCTKCKVRLCCAFGSINRGYFTHGTIPPFNEHVQSHLWPTSFQRDRNMALPTYEEK